MFYSYLVVKVTWKVGFLMEALPSSDWPLGIQWEHLFYS